MKKNSKIDVITNADIYKDFEAIFKHKIISNSIKLAIFLLYYVFAVWLIMLIPVYIIINLITVVAFCATGVYVLSYYIKNIIELLQNRKMILEGKYKIVTEKVVATTSNERQNKLLVLGLFVNPVLVFFIIEPKPHRITFSGFGDYKVLSGKHYVSSTMYEMNEIGVYNSSVTGDTCYLVTCGNNIALAYNTKMFEYKENV